MSKSKPRGAMGMYNCEHCAKSFAARVADRNRGWARFCSKSCAMTAKQLMSAKPKTTNDEVVRVVVIPSCKMCIHRDHKGGFGFISYVPVCRNMRGRELPHDIVRKPSVKGGVAVVKDGIPEWCPLEKGVLCKV